MSTLKEAAIEKFLDAEVRRRGGFTVKLDPHGYKGIQDRLVVLPRRILFVELKRPRGGVVAELQRWWQARVRTLGHEAHIVNTEAGVLKVLDGEVPEG